MIASPHPTDQPSITKTRRARHYINLFSPLPIGAPFPPISHLLLRDTRLFSLRLLLLVQPSSFLAPVALLAQDLRNAVALRYVVISAHPPPTACRSCSLHLPRAISGARKAELVCVCAQRRPSKWRRIWAIPSCANLEQQPRTSPSLKPSIPSPSSLAPLISPRRALPELHHLRSPAALCIRYLPRQLPRQPDSRIPTCIAAIAHSSYTRIQYASRSLDKLAAFPV